LYATIPLIQNSVCGVAHDWDMDYLPIDWMYLLGHPFNLRANSVAKRYGINFLGGDTNAIRVLSHALKVWG